MQTEARPGCPRCARVRLAYVLAAFFVLFAPAEALAEDCVPDCTGKKCGPDGCGGKCGKCPPGGGVCVNGVCTLDCLGISEKGCCDGQRLLQCDDGQLYELDCWWSQQCGWHAAFSAYFCDTDGTADPSGQFPKECVFDCTQECSTIECGPGACGGDCGQCGDGEVCHEGSCCLPICNECGDNGCGGWCGDCLEGDYCDKSGKCQFGFGCIPRWKPGCPGCACEECVCMMFPECCLDQWTEICSDWCNVCDYCGPCKPGCSGKICGTDGCWGSCGECPKGQVCSGGETCCTPDCAIGEECGSDGCGGACGQCESGYSCKSGKCVATWGCEPSWWPGCGGCPCEEWTCAYDDWCCVIAWDEQCVWECEAAFGGCGPCDCKGKECGPDACGGKCGMCALGFKCSAEGKCCVSDCQGKECGTDGCTGTCGPNGSQGGGGGYGGKCEVGAFCDEGLCSVDCATQCLGLQCGKGRCDGDCGHCPGDQLCIEGTCYSGCAGIPSIGCCTADHAYRCNMPFGGGKASLTSCEGECTFLFNMVTVECLLWPQYCAAGPDNEHGWYDCAFGAPTYDPLGLTEKECKLGCPDGPDCEGMECGPDGCGSECGACPPGSVCRKGKCCIRKCDVDGGCGPDGCGGWCGPCGPGMMCGSDFLCHPCPESPCDGVECGPDACGNYCGTCPGKSECAAGKCVEVCEGLSTVGCCHGDTRVGCLTSTSQTPCGPGNGYCGWGSKGYTCGQDSPSEDPSGEFPRECWQKCFPNCTGRECGTDGCGGSCGECASFQECVYGKCKGDNPEEGKPEEPPDTVEADDPSEGAEEVQFPDEPEFGEPAERPEEVRTDQQADRGEAGGDGTPEASPKDESAPTPDSLQPDSSVEVVSLEPEGGVVRRPGCSCDVASPRGSGLSILVPTLLLLLGVVILIRRRPAVPRSQVVDQ